MKGAENKLSLEKYLDYVDSNKRTHLKIDFLQKIANMHGFKRVGGTKSVVIDAVKTIDLMNPSRSTLKENISSAMSVTLNDVIEDLNELGWQECCVTSIKMLNSSQDEDKEKQDSFSNLQQVSKSIRHAYAASTFLYAGSEVDEKSKRWVKKRKRNERSGGNSSMA